MPTGKRTAEERAMLIGLSLEVTYDLGFSLQERAALHGINEDVGQNPEYLYRELVELGKGDNVEERCEELLVLHALLAKVGCRNPASKREFVERERYQCLSGMTFKEWLAKCTSIVDIRHATEQLRYMST